MNGTFPALTHNIIQLDEEQAYCVSDFLKRHAFNPYSTRIDFEHFVTQSFMLTKELPFQVINALLEFRRGINSDGVLVIRGLPIEESRIGPTPTHWSIRAQTKQYYETEMYLVGMASIIGEVFSLSAQHEGNIIQNLVPIKSDANEQMGTGSKVFLEWHTEDAFHDWYADFIGLLCLRSDPNAATTFASVRSIDLPEDYKRCLFERKFQAGIDKAHGGSERPEEGSLISVLSGRYDDPYIRLDTDCIRAIPDEPKAQEALEYLINEIPSKARQIVLKKGDLLFLDNLTVVHGRTAFTPRFNGTDRWLQRIGIAADFRKSYVGRTKKFRVVEMDSKSFKA
jgi:L-asparagine oxygenase